MYYYSHDTLMYKWFKYVHYHHLHPQHQQCIYYVVLCYLFYALLFIKWFLQLTMYVMSCTYFIQNGFYDLSALKTKFIIDEYLLYRMYLAYYHHHNYSRYYTILNMNVLSVFYVVMHQLQLYLIYCNVHIHLYGALWSYMYMHVYYNIIYYLLVK